MHEIDASMEGSCGNELSTVLWGGQGDAALVGGTAHPTVACWQTAINAIAIHPFPGLEKHRPPPTGRWLHCWENI